MIWLLYTLLVIAFFIALFLWFTRKVWFYRDPDHTQTEQDLSALRSPVYGRVSYIRKIKDGVVISEKKGEEILKTMLDNGDCLDIPLNKISRISMMPDFFAINARCLDFNHHEYELVFPKREDLLTYGHELVK